MAHSTQAHYSVQAVYTHTATTVTVDSEESALLDFENSTPEELRTPTSAADLAEIEAMQVRIKLQELRAAQATFKERRVYPFCPGKSLGDRKVYLCESIPDVLAAQARGRRPKRVRRHGSPR